MPKIETFVIIDLETTGLPHREYNRTKITEICLLAVSRKDIRNTKPGDLPAMCKLSFMLNPEKEITPDSARITGITNEMVKNSPTFKGKINTLNTFLSDLNKPVCLVAHNGNTFDYRILLAECVDANASLPDELLCVDSLSIFKKISPKEVKSPVSQQEKSFDSVDRSMNIEMSMNNTLLSDIMTDDEDDWPELNVTPEQLEEIDGLCLSFSGLSSSNTPLKRNESKQRESYKLIDIYTRIFGEFEGTAHRAEDDCVMLLQCIVASQIDFLKYSDSNCKLLSDCKPLERKMARKTRY